MLDLRRLEAIRLNPKPLFQRVVGTLLLIPNYENPLAKTHIHVEGEEHFPMGGGAILIMNHTDRYNYWPFQYWMWRRKLGYTATWVKGKYYENRAMGWFMDAGNNIPVPSLGYVLTKDFQARYQRLPEDVEYSILRRHLEDQIGEVEAMEEGGARVSELLRTGYKNEVLARFAKMNACLVALSQEALSLGLYLLVFPQGTRSIRLSKGHPGVAQIALHTGAKVVPIGSNGSDRCYPADSPVSRGGRIVYRIGKPLNEQDLAPFRPVHPFVPFSKEADAEKTKLQALTDLMMDRINALLDPPYQFAPEDSLISKEPFARRFV